MRRNRRHKPLALPPPAPYVPPQPFVWPANPIAAQIRARQRMAALVDLLEDIAESDMGWLPHAEAARFHRAVSTIADLHKRVA